MCSRYDGQFSNGNGNAATIDCMDRPTMRQRDISRRSHSGAKANDQNGKSTQFDTDRRRERERENRSLQHTQCLPSLHSHIYIIYWSIHRRRERKTSLRFENNSEAKKTSDAVHKLICVILQCNE